MSKNAQAHFYVVANVLSQPLPIVGLVRGEDWRPLGRDPSPEKQVFVSVLVMDGPSRSPALLFMKSPFKQNKRTLAELLPGALFHSSGFEPLCSTS